MITLHSFIAVFPRGLKLTVKPVLAPDALDWLTAYDWPGHVRKLKNLIERALIQSRGDTLSLETISAPQVPGSREMAREEAEIEPCFRWMRLMPSISGRIWTWLIARSRGLEELPESLDFIQMHSGTG